MDLTYPDLRLHQQLRAHDQVVALHQNEAAALHQGLNLYHYRMRYLMQQRKLYLQEAVTLPITQRLHTRLSQLLAGGWPRDQRRRLKARRWRLEYHELLLLNRLLTAGELFAAQDAHESGLNGIYAKLNQAAHRLDQRFEL